MIDIIDIDDIDDIDDISLSRQCDVGLTVAEFVAKAAPVDGNYPVCIIPALVNACYFKG